MDALISDWQERIRSAGERGEALCLRGGGSKAFYGGEPIGTPFAVDAYRGIVAYEPTELVITARTGTSLSQLLATLASEEQCLPCEPPFFAASATVGGMLASGLSGPGRATAGAVRDFVLGVKLLSGTGELLTFGGQVMKNVAGYDVPRLIAGSLGTLALLLEVSLKVLPRPLAEQSIRMRVDEREALVRLNRWGGQPLPVSATAWYAGELTIRLAGAVAAVAAARDKLGGDVLDDEEARAFWLSLREQTHVFFAGDAPLWRLSLPSVAAPLPLGPTLIEWGGAQRWLRAGDPAAIRAVVHDAHGHATLFRADPALKAAVGVFQPLNASLLRIHRELKRAFDPRGVFNPGRLYPEF